VLCVLRCIVESYQDIDADVAQTVCSRALNSTRDYWLCLGIVQRESYLRLVQERELLGVPVGKQARI